MIGTIAKSVAVLAGGLIVGDIAGVIALTLVDIIGLLFPALSYVVWFVFGVFVGLLSFTMAGAWSSRPAGEGTDWTGLPSAKQTGTIVLVAQIALVLALCWLFDWLYWSQDVAGEYYVPDSMVHSLIYVVAVVGAIVLARFALMPTRGTK